VFWFGTCHSGSIDLHPGRLLGSCLHALGNFAGVGTKLNSQYTTHTSGKGINQKFHLSIYIYHKNRIPLRVKNPQKKLNHENHKKMFFFRKNRRGEPPADFDCIKKTKVQQIQLMIERRCQ